jgi:hypothetical protein
MFTKAFRGQTQPKVTEAIEAKLKEKQSVLTDCRKA